MAQHADRQGDPAPFEAPASGSGSFGPPDTGVTGVTGLAGAAGLLIELAEADPTDWTPGERADAVRALAAVRGQVDAALARAVGAFDANVDFAADGARSTAAWVTARTGLSRAEATGLEHRGRDLRSCPTVEAAYRTGVVGTAKVRALLQAREHVEALFAEHERELIDVVRDLTVARARIYLSRWHRTALASTGQDDGPAPDDPAANSFHVSTTFEGRRAITGDLDAVHGATLQHLLEGEVDRLFTHGGFRADDGLLPSQRNARALLSLCERGAQHSTQHGEPRASVTILVDLATLLGLPVEDPADLLTRRCELADGTALTLDAVLRQMQDATLNVLLGHWDLTGRFQPAGEVRVARAANGRQRRALAARDQGCVFPGCDRPARWTQAHHLDGWEPTHLTAVPRLVLLCSFHHHRVHEHGFTLTADHHGHVTVHRPDGTALPAPPPGERVPDDPDPPPPGRFRTLAERRTAAERERAEDDAIIRRRFEDLRASA